MFQEYAHGMTRGEHSSLEPWLTHFDSFELIAKGVERLTWHNDERVVSGSMPFSLVEDYEVAPKPKRHGGKLYSYNKDENRNKIDEGMRHWTSAHTFSRTHVQRYLFHFLISDFDPGTDISAVARAMADDGLCPHRVMVCPATSGCQTWHRMAIPVSWKNEKRRGMMRYVCGQMATRYGADPNYRNGCVAGYSPFSANLWSLEQEYPELSEFYELETISEILGVVPTSYEAEGQEVARRIRAEGRNVSLFETLRTTALPKVKEYTALGQNQFHAWCVGAAKEAHTQLGFTENPLLDAEIQGVARSVSKWVWERRYNWHTEGEYHARKGRASGLVRAISVDKRASEAQLLKGKGLTRKEISAMMNVSPRTLTRWLNRGLNEKGRSPITERLSASLA